MNLENFPPVGNQRGLWHGGDYNPEQWPREIWDEDARLMDLAGWNVATIAVFSWVTLEPAEGQFEFDWLDEQMDRMQRGGRKVILATSTAATPAWLDQKYPEVLRTGADGVRNRHGNRVNYCLTSPIYREKCRILVEQLAKRYAGHPALALWHVSNEYGGDCHCGLCAEAFRGWLKAKYGTLDKLNAAYWAAFWSHTFTDWSQLDIPGEPHGETSIHGLTLDWKRFVTDQTIALYENEAAILRRHTPKTPITTNLMGFYGGVNYEWLSKHLDVVCWDSYPAFSGPLVETSTWQTVAMAHDLYRAFLDKPFLLMECTPSSSNWYPRMALKRPGMHMLEGLQAIAHGSDSVQYFQWRASRGSGEKLHGAIVQQDGTEHARVFQEVADLGRMLESIREVSGSTTEAEVALIYDWETSWAILAAAGPLQGERGYKQTVQDHYRPFWQAGIPVDIIGSEKDFSKYRLLIAPMLYMIRPGVAERIEAFVRAGGTFVTTYHSGIADESDLCFQGFPGPLRKLLGVWNEELDVLYDGQTNAVDFDDGNALGLQGGYEARTFCARIHAEGAEIIARYASDFYSGEPALTVNRVGEGSAYYIASRNDGEFQQVFFRTLGEQLGLRRTIRRELPSGVTAQRRENDEREFVFLLNCTGTDQNVNVKDEQLRDAVTGIPTEEARLKPWGVKVLIRDRHATE